MNFLLNGCSAAMVEFGGGLFMACFGAESSVGITVAFFILTQWRSSLLRTVTKLELVTGWSWLSDRHVSIYCWSLGWARVAWGSWMRNCYRLGRSEGSLGETLHHLPLEGRRVWGRCSFFGIACIEVVLQFEFFAQKIFVLSVCSTFLHLVTHSKAEKYLMTNTYVFSLNHFYHTF